VRLDLRGVFLPLQTQRLDEALRERAPVDVRIADGVRVEVADRAVDLAGDVDGRELRALAFQSRDDIGHFLAERGGRCGLAVGAREHRQVGVGVREVAQLRDRLVGFGQQHVLARVAQHQGIRKIVDVFRRAGEMHEFFRLFQRRIVADAFLDEILDRLDVVIRRRLDLLDTRGIGDRKILGNLLQARARRGRKRWKLRDARFIGKRDQPRDLHRDTPVHQAVFAEDRTQGVDFGRVAAVQRREGGEGIELHAGVPWCRESGIVMPTARYNERLSCRDFHQCRTSAPNTTAWAN